MGHLLKWDYQPDKRSKSWRVTIRKQRREILQLLRENPSLKPYLAEAIAHAHLIPKSGSPVLQCGEETRVGDFSRRHRWYNFNMKQTLTLVCKLQPSPEQSLKIEELLKAFADACNFANEAVKPAITSKTTIQNRVYQELRSRFGLSANQAVRVCARVSANRKTAKTKGKPVKMFKPTSADYDARIFAFREKDCSVSLTLLNGREHIKLDVGNYQHPSRWSAWTLGGGKLPRPARTKVGMAVS